jgi:hypothetical protein
VTEHNGGLLLREPSQDLGDVLVQSTPESKLLMAFLPDKSLTNHMYRERHRTVGRVESVWEIAMVRSGNFELLFFLFFYDLHASFASTKEARSAMFGSVAETAILRTTELTACGVVPS